MDQNLPPDPTGAPANNPTDDQIRYILQSTQTIALVGASPNPLRPSNSVGQFLTRMGYRVIGINPEIAGKTLFGQPVYARLSDIPKEITIDLVDIFRRSDRVEPVVNAALTELNPPVRFIWMQIGVVHAQAAATARAAGITVVQNRCPKIDYARLIA